MRYVLSVLLFTIFNFVNAQKSDYSGFPSLIWPKLYTTTFIQASDASGEFQKPVFTDAVKNLNAKAITLPGYMVPFESGTKSNHFMLSSLPLNACFFCGVGGPETAVEVFLKKEVTYTDKPIEIRGTLHLNDKDPDQMIYILKDAEIIGAPGF